MVSVKMKSIKYIPKPVAIPVNTSFWQILDARILSLTNRRLSTGIQNVTTKAISTRLRTSKLPENRVHHAKTSTQPSGTTNPPAAPNQSNNNNNNNETYESNETIKSLQDAVHFQPLPAKKIISSQSTEETAISNDNNGAMDSMSSEENEKLNTRFQGISLKDFEQHQKLVEEQNKQKKELLTRAIEQRYEQNIAYVQLSDTLIPSRCSWNSLTNSVS